MLKYRLISGTLMLLGILALFWLDGYLESLPLHGSAWQSLFRGRSTPPPGMVLMALMVVLVPLAARELTAVFHGNGIAVQTWLISLAGIAAAATVYLTPKSLSAPTGVAIIASVLVAVFIFSCIWQARHQNVKGVVAAAGAAMFSVAYLGLMGGFYLAIRRWHSAWVVLAIVVITKMGDTGAYTVGRMIGKHKLIPWLSPGKTIEGLFGAMLFSVGFATGFAYLSQHTQLTTIHRTVDHVRVAIEQTYDVRWAWLVGILLALVGHAGDLMMSLFKRGAGLKDSGNIIPGFGGVLDVLDSPLLVAPVAYWMLEFTATR